MAIGHIQWTRRIRRVLLTVGFSAALLPAQNAQVERARAAADAAEARQQASVSIVKQRAATLRQLEVTKAMRPALSAFAWNWQPAYSGGGSYAANFEFARADCPQVAAPELGRMIATASQKTGVDAELVREVARQESAFRPCSVSVKGAEGLMQLMPETQVMLGVRNPLDPNQSLQGGAELLRQLLLRYGGNVALALSAYNAGASRVDQAGGIPDIAETQDYVSTILSRLGSR